MCLKQHHYLLQCGQVEADAKAATRAMLQLQQELGVVRLLLAQKEQAAARQAKALEEQVTGQHTSIHCIHYQNMIQGAEPL